MDDIILTPAQQRCMSKTGYKDPIKFLAYYQRGNKRRNEKRKNKPLSSDYANNKDLYISRQLKKNYGISLEVYDEMFETQSGRCKICNEPETSKLKGVIKRLAVDHCHATGKVRGLLCSNCNRALGFFRDSTSNLESAIKYLNGGE